MDPNKRFFSPAIIIASVSSFAGFCSICVERDFTRLSSLTFYIYLFHALIYMVLFKFVDQYPGGELVKIAGVTVLTFFIALFCAMVYQMLWALVTKQLLTFEKWNSLKIWS